jgi:ABC-2 type transport system ATP-binding protein
MTEQMVDVCRLSKYYGQQKAVDGISFQVRKGEIFGLLGPNGAGKTTTLECLEGLRRPDSGSVEVLGVNPHKEPGKLRDMIGVQLQDSALPATMGVNEAMAFFSAYHRKPPRFDLLERFGLSEKRQARYETLSTGQKRRLALALAIAHQPAVLLLDEPTAGLDVATRAELHRLIRELRQAGTTVILSTHDMAEAEDLADRVAILLGGKIVASGSPRELTATGNGLTKISVAAAGTDFEQADFPKVVHRRQEENYHIYYTSDTGPTVSSIIGYIQTSGGRLLDLRVERPSLEERFLELTTKEAV